MSENYTGKILVEIESERERQDVIWPQQMTCETTPWLGILMEEVGEVARATLGNADAGNLRRELIQVAAVAAAWAEWLDRWAEKEVTKKPQAGKNRRPGNEKSII